MNIFNIFKRKKQIEHKEIKRRSYAAASTDRLFSSWSISLTSADNEIKTSLKTLVARARQLARDNDYAKKYLKLCVTNIVGPNGIKLQSKAVDPTRRLDKIANKMIEDAWKDWGKKENASIDGILSWRDIQRLVIETVARDGSVLILKHRGAPNKYGFALSILEIDHLDVDYTDINKNIKMGIQYDTNNKPIAYHVYPSHPGDLTYSYTYQERRVIPASDIIHLFYRDRPSQTRGITWMHSAMTRLNMIGAYEEAELVAARVGASQMGIYTNSTGDFPEDEKDDNNTVMEVEPGVFIKAPQGYDVKMFDPKHPAGNFDPFLKRALMGAAAGLNVAYNSLANDLSEVNYSSLRAGSLDERDNWKVYQDWLVNSFISDIYSSWLYMALLTQALPLSPSKYEKYNYPLWFPRSWDWVDPLKDSQAAISEINAGLSSKSDVLAEQGRDFEELVETIKSENEMLKEAGIKIQGVQNGNTNETTGDNKQSADNIEA